MKILRILVPVDFSKESAFALEWAQMVAKKTPGATIYLLHVLPPTAVGMGSVGYEMEKEEVEKKLEAIQNKLPDDLLSFLIQETGSIASVVAKVCTEKNIDLVVMTTRGRRGMKHFLPESTTEETVRLAPCPVLVLHLNAKGQAIKQKAA